MSWAEIVLYSPCSFSARSFADLSRGSISAAVGPVLLRKREEAYASSYCFLSLLNSARADCSSFHLMSILD